VLPLPVVKAENTAEFKRLHRIMNSINSSLPICVYLRTLWLRHASCGKQATIILEVCCINPNYKKWLSSNSSMNEEFIQWLTSKLSIHVLFL
jgi:hypothetical protein